MILALWHPYFSMFLFWRIPLTSCAYTFGNIVLSKIWLVRDASAVQMRSYAEINNTDII